MSADMESGGDDQAAVLRFLGDSATYGGAAVKRIDTHAASVFLAGGRALKIKRAVRFPFLDFSTLAQRKAACEAELAVNAPYAPEIYRRVLAITREPAGGLAIGGKGAPVEWAVEMRRFDETRTLDRAADAIDAALAEDLGRAVAAAHARARPVEAAPWIAALASYIDDYVAAFERHPEIFAKAAIDALARISRSVYGRLVPLLHARGRRGLVRRIHGDLHLGNIALIDGKPVVFDAIEFSEIIGSGDVLYDLAFLLMDLLERGLSLPANIVFNRYLAQTPSAEDLDGLAALPFFLSLRAAIRANVTTARMERAPDAERAAIARSARAYFEFAGRAIERPKRCLIAVGGLSGTGKSQVSRTLAAYIAPLPGAVILRSDVERKALFGVAETESLPPTAYAPEVADRVYAVMLDKARRILAAGHSAILDAVFAKPDERSAAAALASAAGVRFHGFFLTAALQTRLTRAGNRAQDASDAGEKVVRAQESYDLGPLDWTQIDASGTVEQTAARLRATLD